MLYHGIVLTRRRRCESSKAYSATSCCSFWTQPNRHKENKRQSVKGQYSTATGLTSYCSRSARVRKEGVEKKRILRLQRDVPLNCRLEDICWIGCSTAFLMKLGNTSYMTINWFVYPSSANWRTLGPPWEAKLRRASCCAHRVSTGVYRGGSCMYTICSGAYTGLSDMYSIPSIPNGSTV